jgi:hypothetical protein
LLNAGPFAAGTAALAPQTPTQLADDCELGCVAVAHPASHAIAKQTIDVDATHVNLRFERILYLFAYSCFAHREVYASRRKSAFARQHWSVSFRSPV